MSSVQRPARVGRLAIVVLAMLAVGGVGFGLYHVRAARVAAREMAELERGQEAIAAGDWLAAATHLARYVRRNGEDWLARRDFADVQLRLRPLGRLNMVLAADNYRQVLRAAKSDARLAGQIDRQRLYTALARLYRGLHDPSELLHIADQRLLDQPDDPAARWWRCEALLALQDEVRARTELAALVESYADAAEWPEPVVRAQLARARRLFDADNAGTLVELRATLEPIRRRCPDHAGAAVLELDALWQRARRAAGDERAELASEARALLEELSARAQLSPVLRLALAHRWMELFDYPQAAGQLAQAAAASDAEICEEFVNPADFAAALFLERGRYAMETGDRALGAELLAGADVFTEQVHQLTIALMVVRLHLLADEPEVAAERLTRLRGLLPTVSGHPFSDDELDLAEAEVALAARQPFRAIALLEPLLRSDPAGARPTARNVRGLLAAAYQRVGQHDRALPLLEEVAGRQPGDETAWRTLIEQQLRLGRAAEALAIAQRAAGELFPDSRALRKLRIRARLLTLDGPPRATDDKFAALEHELDALAAEGDDEAVTLRAQLCAVRGDAAAAVELLQSSLAERPDSNEIELALASLLAERGHLAAARPHLEAVLERTPQQARAWEELARVDLLLGERARAIETLRRAVASVGEPAARSTLTCALARTLLAGSAAERAAAVALLRAHAAEHPRDTAVRVALLDARPCWAFADAAANEAEAERLIGELRAIEQPAGGVLWRFEQARRLLARSAGTADATEIRELLDACITARPAWTEPYLLRSELELRLARQAIDAGAPDAFARRLEAAVTDTLRGIPRGPAAAGRVERLVDLLLLRDEREAVGLAERLRQENPALFAALDLRTRLLGGDWEAGPAALAPPDDAGAPERLAALAERVAVAAVTRQRVRDDETAAALDWLRDAGDAFPGVEPLFAARLAVLEQRGRRDEAVALWDARLAAHPDDPALIEGRFVYAADALWRTRPDEALATLRAGLERAPQSTALRIALLRALIATAGVGAAEEIERHFAALADDDDDPAGLRLLRAAWLNTRGASPQDAESVRELLARTIAEQPDNAEAYGLLVNEWLRAGEPERAREVARRGLVRLPRHPLTVAALAQAEAACGQLAAARQRLLELLEQAPDERAFVVAAEVLVAAGDVDALCRFGDAWAALLARGAATQSVRLAAVVERADAERFVAALELADGPTVERAARLLADPAGGDRRGAAVRLLTGWLAAHPDDVPARVALAGVYQHQNEPERMIAELRGVLERDADHVEALNNLAWVLAERAGGDTAALAAALAHADRAVELAGRSSPSEGALVPDMLAATLDTRAFVLRGMGRLDEARRNYEQALARGPRSGNAVQAAAWVRTLVDLLAIVEDGQAVTYAAAIRRALELDAELGGQGVLSPAQRLELGDLVEHPGG